MALSGSFYTNVGSHWRLQIEWSGSQNIANNYTDITAKMYWIGLDGYSEVYSSATKTSAMQYNDGSWSTESGQLAKLSAYQKKLINTYSFRITHNSNGTGSFNIDGYFDAEVTLAGTYYGRIDMAQKSFTLNTIPRASSLSSSASWNAGHPLSASVSSASSSFTHSIDVYVRETGGSLNWITQKTGVKSSTTFNFSDSENIEIFTILDGRSSCQTMIRVTTYDGSTKIGDAQDKYGTVTAPNMTRLANGFDKWVYPDQTIGGDLVRYHSDFTTNIEITFGSFTKNITGATTSFSWTPNTQETKDIYAQMPNDTIKRGNMRLRSYYKGVLVRTYLDAYIEFYARNVEPNFDSSNISYKDTNSVTLGITNNDQSIIQNQGEITAYVNTSAQAQQSSSLVKYIISVAGVEKELTSATGSVSIGKINQSANQSLEITAVDSRGYQTTVSKTIDMIPYTEPQLVLKLDRVNKFETTTNIDVSGSFSPLNIGGSNKNLIQGLKYRKRVKGGTWEAFKTINYTTSGTTFDGTKFSYELDNTKAWDLEFTVTDKITSNTDPATVGTGKPILFMDSEKNSVGIGVFPTNNNALELAGNMVANEVFIDKLYGKTLYDYIVADHGNGNVTLSAQGGELYLGYRNTSKLRMASDLYNNTSDRRIIDATGSVIDVERLKLRSGGDATSTSTLHGLTIGDSDTTGGSIKIDTNEVSAFFESSEATLHLNADGGNVTFNNSVGGSKALIIEEGFIQNESHITCSLKNGWTNYGGSYVDAFYWKDKNGVVHLCGLINGSGSGTMFTLPAGYRPRETEIHTSTLSGNLGRIDIYNNGNVNHNGAGSGWLTLSGISFKAYY